MSSPGVAESKVVLTDRTRRGPPSRPDRLVISEPSVQAFQQLTVLLGAHQIGLVILQVDLGYPALPIWV